MKGSLVVLVLAAGVAHAAVNGTTVLNYSVTNNTGATANDLHVDTNGMPDSASSPDFTTTIGSAVQFTNGDITSGSSATFTLGANGGSIAPSNPYVIDYCWADPGADSLCSEAPSATQYDPLYFFFGPTIGSFDLNLGSSSSTPVDYADLSVMQDGNNLLLGTVNPSSGSVDSMDSLQLTGSLDPSQGPIDFSVIDTTDGLTINGSFTGTPEPATTSVCVLMLAAMIVTVRRRQLRK